MDYVNSTRIVGRVSALGEPRELPSGDTVLTVRVVVPRGPRESRGSAVRVDTIDVACWSSTSRRAAARLAVDDVVDVEGGLRRRFFRAGGSVGSRYEVEARTIRRCRPQAES